MATYVRCDANGVILEIFRHDTLLPRDTHRADIAAQFVAAPDNVQGGGTFITGRYTAPTPPAPSDRKPIVTPPEFMLLWTLTEQVQLEALRAEDAPLRVFFERLQDPRLSQVDMNLGSVQEGIEYALGKLNYAADVIAARKTEILSGVFK